MVRRTVPSLGREGLGELLGEVRGRQRHSVYSGDRGMESSRRQSSTIGAVSPRMVLIALTSLVSIGSRQPGVSDANRSEPGRIYRMPTHLGAALAGDKSQLKQTPILHAARARY